MGGGGGGGRGGKPEGKPPIPEEGRGARVFLGPQEPRSPWVGCKQLGKARSVTGGRGKTIMRRYSSAE